MISRKTLGSGRCRLLTAMPALTLAALGPNDPSGRLADKNRV
jgi:hypothetical protein